MIRGTLYVPLAKALEVVDGLDLSPLDRACARIALTEAVDVDAIHAETVREILRETREAITNINPKEQHS